MGRSKYILVPLVDLSAVNIAIASCSDMNWKSCLSTLCLFLVGLTLAQEKPNDKSVASDYAVSSPFVVEQSPNALRRLDSSSCNLTLYQQWSSELYTGVLSSDVDFWIYQTQPQVVLTNGLALELVVIFCKRQFTHLYFYKAGKSGPITIQNGYKPMCSSYCLQSDILHQRAMAASGCNCLELSTQNTSDAYTAAGDWCAHNSARLLCDMLGYCGVWECATSDFMCPRYEWNKKQIAYLGPGTCTSAANSFTSMSGVFFSCVFVMSLVVTYFLS